MQKPISVNIQKAKYIIFKNFYHLTSDSFNYPEVKEKRSNIMLPEEKARIKIDKQLIDAGWDIVAREDYIPNYNLAVKEALMQGGNESDYLLFIDNKAIAVIEAKREENTLVVDVAEQAENYAVTPEKWYGTWFDNLIPLVYLANGNKILYKNMLEDPNGNYIELKEMHSPKKMLKIINQKSEYGALPRIDKKGLRDCQYNAEYEFEKTKGAINGFFPSVAPFTIVLWCDNLNFFLF